jgi:Domain of unknown function (DUF5658)
MATRFSRHARTACLALTLVLSSASALAGQNDAVRGQWSAPLSDDVRPAATPEREVPALAAQRVSTAVLAPLPGTEAAAFDLAVPSGRLSLPRPRLLTPLNVSFALLQALDVHSSMRAIERGGREANPVFESLDQWPAAVAVKAASTLGVVLLTNTLSRRHPKRAVLTMIALDSAYCWIVAHNYSAAR